MTGRPRGYQPMRPSPRTPGWLVRVMHRAAQRRIPKEELCARAGIGVKTLDNWIAGRGPSLYLAECLLQVVGLRFVIEEIDHEDS